MVTKMPEGETEVKYYKRYYLFVSILHFLKCIFVEKFF